MLPVYCGHYCFHFTDPFRHSIGLNLTLTFRKPHVSRSHAGCMLIYCFLIVSVLPVLEVFRTSSTLSKMSFQILTPSFIFIQGLHPKCCTVAAAEHLKRASKLHPKRVYILGAA